MSKIVSKERSERIMMDAITVLGMLAVVCGMLWAFQSDKLRLGRHEG